MTPKVVRYSETFKREVVAEYESGASLTSLTKKYAIGNLQTIQRWVRKYGKEGLRHEVMRIQTAEEANRIYELERQVEELQQALGKITLEKLKLESILDVLQGDEVEPVKKNAARSFNASRKKSESEG